MADKNHAVIIVPTQGEDRYSFQAVAQALKSKVYGGKATVVYAAIAESNGRPMVALYSDKKLSKPFAFKDGQGLKTVMTVSHGFSGDGPNLGYHDESVPEKFRQPWPKDPADPSQLSPEAKAIWSAAGKALSANGKVILLGCFMGAGTYDDLVAQASGRTVYAATDSFGAGNTKVAVPAVASIERNKPPKVINRTNFTPTSSR